MNVFKFLKAFGKAILTLAGLYVVGYALASAALWLTDNSAMTLGGFCMAVALGCLAGMLTVANYLADR